MNESKAETMIASRMESASIFMKLLRSLLRQCASGAETISKERSTIYPAIVKPIVGIKVILLSDAWVRHSACEGAAG